MRWREKPRDSHSAMSAGDHSGSKPYDPPDYMGCPFGEKKPACLAKGLKQSVTRNADRYDKHHDNSSDAAKCSNGLDNDTHKASATSSSTGKMQILGMKPEIMIV